MLPAEDFEEFDILPHLLEAIAFLSRAETSGGCAFVHCNYGVNRSGVVAAAYLMVAERKPLLQVSPFTPIQAQLVPTILVHFRGREAPGFRLSTMLIHGCNCTHACIHTYIFYFSNPEHTHKIST